MAGKRNAVALVGLVLSLMTGAASAEDTAQSFEVSATVRGNCVIDPEPLAFGEYFPGAGPVDAESTISVSCSNGTPYTLSLDYGTAPDGSAEARRMSNGEKTLEYQLYVDAARTVPWAAGTPDGVVAGEGVGMGEDTTRAIPVFGRVLDTPSNQSVPEGSYSDVITVTITF